MARAGLARVEAGHEAGGSRRPRPATAAGSSACSPRPRRRRPSAASSAAAAAASARSPTASSATAATSTPSASSPWRTNRACSSCAGDDVQKANHAYGTNGIITELEVPLGPAYAWIDSLVTFADFMAAARFAQALGRVRRHPQEADHADGLAGDHVLQAADRHPRRAPTAVMSMVAEPSVEAFDALVRAHGGRLGLPRAVGGLRSDAAALRVHVEPHDAARHPDRTRRSRTCRPLPAGSQASSSSSTCTGTSATR